MKKQILVIFTGAMELGGIERSLLGLLDAFDYNKYNVDLFLYGHHGPLMSLINENVNILPEVKELAYLRESFKVKLKNKCFYSAVLRLKDELISKFHMVNNDTTWAKVMRRCAPKLQKHYDIALSFFRPFDFIVEKVDADIKVGWIHTDYTNAGEILEVLEKDYARMDYIAAVSDQCAETFNSIFPNLKNRVITIENVLSRDYINKEANRYDVSDEMLLDGSIKLLTVGRFSYPKKMEEIPEICRRIRESGLNVKWYLIGFGKEEQLIRQKIREENMEKYVVILGKKENPYPYIKACDIYLQPSRYEGKAVTVREAQILNKPVIITNYATSNSQLQDGIDGVIVPKDIAGCSKGIIQVVNDKRLQQRLIENTKIVDYTNSLEVEKIYCLMR
ncbi:glycosyltransferase [Ruminococcus sp. MCC718]|uniref:glycosyltransferase n=1 Tax=Ruminococcus sp. MCC718 TaxID=2592649 RepID=UPI001C02FF89|nr:glycosyltransferase [Ruminococcus sp. MCC718]MBT9653280.1 glycosyltransferase [Ruminococcus sp. MCC718]